MRHLGQAAIASVELGWIVLGYGHRDLLFLASGWHAFSSSED